MLTHDTEYQRVLADRVEVLDQEISYPSVRIWNFRESRFERCTFLNLKADNFVFGSGTRPSLFIECTFDSSSIRADNPGLARFERCRFAKCVIDRWKCNEVEFIDCEFSGQLCGVNFNARPPSEIRSSLGRSINEYQANDFGSATFTDTSFLGGVDLTAQRRLPQFPGYLLLEDAHSRLPEVITEIKSWRPGPERDLALEFLEVQLEWRVGRGQSQLLYSPDDWANEELYTHTYRRMTEALLSHGARETLQLS